MLETDQASGDLQEKVLRIRRLQCKNCLKIHHELPDLLVPHKRYAAATIEATLDETEVALATSTIRRWVSWFKGITCNLLGVLNTMTDDNIVEKTPFSGTPLQRLRQYMVPDSQC